MEMDIQINAKQMKGIPPACMTTSQLYPNLPMEQTKISMSQTMLHC